MQKLSKALIVSLIAISSTLGAIVLTKRYKEQEKNKSSQAVLAEVYEQGMYATNLPQFHCQVKVFDFGIITVGEVVAHEYEFTNTGASPLIIHEVIASCSQCTTVTWPQGLIQVGGSSKIKVVFNSAGRSGKQRRYVIVRANTDPPEIRLLLKGEVKEKL